ncbi:TRPL translocation defect protein 14 isoform X1 [Balamuthia mandrillaris]
MSGAGWRTVTSRRCFAATPGGPPGGRVLGTGPSLDQLAKKGMTEEEILKMVAQKTKPTRFSFMSTHRAVLEYVVGVACGLCVGYGLFAENGFLNPKAQEKQKDLLAQLMLERSRNVYTVVLTGGPCGGKSSAMEHFIKHFEQQGFVVLTLPEVPTLLFQSGVPRDLSKYTPEQLFTFEQEVLNTQIRLEDAAVGVANSLGRKCLILLDRGVLDISAYLPPSLWHQLLDKSGLTEHALRQRYDAVVHLITAAQGAAAFYTTANNAARTETVEEAIALDKKVQQAWLAHPRHCIVDNSTSFKEKLQRSSALLEDALQRTDKRPVGAEQAQGSNTRDTLTANNTTK